jgi:predicted Zn-dependent protease
VQGVSRSGSLALLVLLGALALARADEVILKNGGAVQGRIVSEDDEKVVVETKAGKVTIERARVKEIVRSQQPRQPDPPPIEAPPIEAPPPDAAPQRLLFLFSFEGANPKVTVELARRVNTALGGRVRIQAFSGGPKPDETDAIDKRAERLGAIARTMRLDPGGTLAELEARIRAALAADARPEVRRFEGLVDDACSVRLSVARLEAQAATLAGERLRDPNVIGMIGVTNRDMSTPDASFLVGHADAAARVGVISYLRFGDPSGTVVAHRAAVQLLSTIGGLLGVGACSEVSCARAVPSSLEEHDRKQEQFCATCRRVVDAALAPR